MSFDPSRPRPRGSSAQHGAPAPSPPPPPPPSWQRTPRPKHDALRPATSESPHPRPTDRPRLDQINARFWFWFWVTRAIPRQGCCGLGGPEIHPNRSSPFAPRLRALRVGAGVCYGVSPVWVWCAVAPGAGLWVRGRFFRVGVGEGVRAPYVPAVVF